MFVFSDLHLLLEGSTILFKKKNTEENESFKDSV